MEAFPADNLHIERKVMSREQGDKIIDGVVGFTNLDQSFKDNALIAIMTHDPEHERSIVTLTTINTKSASNTTAFYGFKSIPSLAPITKESQSLSQSANRTQLSGQYRSAGAGSLLVVNDPKVIRYAYDQYDDLVKDMKTLLGPKTFTTILDLQPFQSYMSSYGGAMQASKSSSKFKATLGEENIGNCLAIRGLVFQLAVFTFFMVVTGTFHLGFHRRPTTSSATAQVPWRQFIYVLYIGSVLIIT
ncbi:Ff.00g114620.m01.CDS01 [Fusarium sp. VM40]|nr:Ff.00g114620.m01.CDS01 [Fusarium sp. VM40]